MATEAERREKILEVELDAALHALADVRTAILGEIQQDSLFYNKWLGPACTDPSSIPRLVEAYIAHIKED